MNAKLIVVDRVLSRQSAVSSHSGLKKKLAVQIKIIQLQQQHYFFKKLKKIIHNNVIMKIVNSYDCL